MPHEDLSETTPPSFGYHHGTPFGGRAMPKLVRHTPWVVAGVVLVALGIGLTAAVKKVRDAAAHLADT